MSLVWQDSMAERRRGRVVYINHDLDDSRLAENAESRGGSTPREEDLDPRFRGKALAISAGIGIAFWVVLGGIVWGAGRVAGMW